MSMNKLLVFGSLLRRISFDGGKQHRSLLFLSSAETNVVSVLAAAAAADGGGGVHRHHVREDT